MKTKKDHKREPYLAIPAHILNIRGIGLAEKMLLAHIYSFGAKGCYQSNRTLAEIFMVSERTIRRLLHELGGHVVVRRPKGRYRTIWARAHPDISGREPGQNVYVDPAKDGRQVGRKCPPTNNKTNTETNSRTTATPAPLPAGGQAPALLAHRRDGAVAGVAAFKGAFGRASPEVLPLSPEQFERRRQTMLAALADPPGGHCLHRKDKAGAL